MLSVRLWSVVFYCINIIETTISIFSLYCVTGITSDVDALKSSDEVFNKTIINIYQQIGGFQNTTEALNRTFNEQATNYTTEFSGL